MGELGLAWGGGVGAGGVSSNMFFIFVYGPKAPGAHRAHILFEYLYRVYVSNILLILLPIGIAPGLGLQLY